MISKRSLLEMMAYILLLFYATILGSFAFHVKIHLATWNVMSKPPPNDLSKFLGIDVTFKRTRKRNSINNVPKNIIVDEEPGLIMISLQGNGKSASNWKDALINNLTMRGFDLIDGYVSQTVSFYIFVSKMYKPDYLSRLLDVKLLQTGTIPSTTYATFKFWKKEFLLLTGRMPDREKDASLKPYYEQLINSANKTNVDYYFWLGDLNLKGEKSISETISNPKKFADDQLKSALKNDSFQDWKEQDITFNQTYKFNPGTDEYDNTITPSWTDRILYKFKNENEVELIKYESLNEFTQSDHKPVIAQFNVTCLFRNESP